MSDAKENKFKKLVLEYLPYILIILGVILIKKFVVAPIRVNGDSMFKTLNNGDIMLLNRFDYKFSGIKRFDIVVIDEGDEFIIKRVVGLPGELVAYSDGKLYVNGKKISDKFGYGKTKDFEVRIPEGRYFVLGDNRENSMDSRYFGPFSENKILGTTKLVLFPFKRFGNKQ